ncbi:MAG: hypothetical protein IMZ44_13485 [Planctomycetes bacterium]|nr:hypothetical protein [Planctomycetota bacterium]
MSRTSPPVAAAAVIAVSLCLAAPLGGQAPAWSRLDSQSLCEKVERIERNGAAQPPVPLRTVVTEREVNAYFLYDGRDQVPQGVVDPQVRILGDRRVSARAIVDLDAVSRQRQSRRWLDPMRYLTGRLVVSASGLLVIADGVARIELEVADVAGIPIPKSLLQELLTYYSRTPANPRGLSLDDAYQLPARIRAIEVGRSEAVVVQ